MQKLMLIVLSVALLIPCQALAHHGGVSLALGPGSPIETGSPLTLPEGGLVASTKLEYAPFRKFDFAEPENKDSFTFYNLSLIYGLKPFLSTGLVIPYSVKTRLGIDSVWGRPPSNGMIPWRLFGQFDISAGAAWSAGGR